MKKLSIVVLMLAATCAFAQGKKSEAKKAEPMKLHGYVVDYMCAKGMMKKDNAMARAAKHTKECALEEACAASGFGLVYDGKWVKFDEKGDKLAKAMFEKSKKDKDFMADVMGEMKGDVFVVASFTESNMTSDEMGKSSKSDKEHQHDSHK